LIENLAADLSAGFTHGLSVRNVWQIRSFYLTCPILQTLSALSGRSAISQTASAEFELPKTAAHFPPPGSTYVRHIELQRYVVGTAKPGSIGLVCFTRGVE